MQNASGRSGFALFILTVGWSVFGQMKISEPVQEMGFQQLNHLNKSTSSTAWQVDLNCAWGASGYTWVGDFDGDGADDIASGYGGAVLMHLSRGDHFDNQTWPVANHWNAPHWTWVGDFNGDGRSDICSVSGGNAYMKLSDGSSFTNEIWLLSPSWGSHLYTWVADFNGDGKDDIASASGGSVFMKLSTGSHFLSQTWSVIPLWGSHEYTWVGDFNGDGKADIASGFGSNVRIHLSHGAGFNERAWAGPSAWGHPAYTWVADFNGDGKDDIATGIGDRIELLDPAGGSFFQRIYGISGTWYTAGYTWVADFNGDGKADIATASDARVHFYLGAEQGFEEAFWPVSPAWGPAAYTRVGDFSGDGVADIASPSGCFVYMEAGMGTPIDVHQPDDVIAAVEAFSPTVYFHPDEEFFTDSVDNYLETVYLHGGKVSNDTDYDTFDIEHDVFLFRDWNTYGLENGMDELRDRLVHQFQVPEEEVTFWLATSQYTNLAGSLADTRVYVKVTTDEAGNKLKIQYWYFYPYNGPGRFEACASSNDCFRHQLSEVGRHEGDWENVNVALYLDSGLIDKITLSGHGVDKELTRYLHFEDGTHPIVYSAKYSHAFYHSPGYHEYSRERSLDYGIGTASLDLYDRTGVGQVKRVENPGDYQIVRTNLALPVATSPEWTNYNYRWGALEKLKFEVTIYIFGKPKTFGYKEVGAGPTRHWDR